MARKGAPALYELLGRARGGKSADGKAVTQVQVPIQIPNKVPPRSSPGAGVTLPSTSATSASKSAAKKPVDGSRRQTPFKLPSWGVIGAAFGVVSLVLVIQLWRSQGSDGEPAGSRASIQPSTPPVVDSPSDSTGLAVEVPVASGRRDPARVSDAVRAQPPDASDTPAPRATAAQAPSASENRAPAPAADSDQPLGPMPKGIDPRQSGLNYFVVASVLEANADKIVQFCRDRGLDAWVVPDHNGRLREITILPGVPKSELEGVRAKALKARIQIGRASCRERVYVLV